MESTSVALVALLAIMAAYVGHQVYQSYSGQNYRRRLMENLDPTENEEELRTHTEQFKQGVKKVDSTHANGYVTYGLSASLSVG